MTSPYSSNLLQHSDDGNVATEQPAYPYAPNVGQQQQQHQQPQQQHTVMQREVVRYAPQAAPLVSYAPQQQPVVYVQAPATRSAGGGISAVLLALIVVLVGAVAVVGGYYMTKNASPSALEANTQVGLASDQAFLAGRAQGVAQGRSTAADMGSTTSALSAAITRESAYQRAYRQGLTAGNHTPRSSGYRGGYRRGYSGYRYSGPSQVQTALGSAQSLANATGAPVDVEIY